jgi:hypothetical protein
MKQSYFTFVAVALMIASTHAALIFDASTANTTIIGNNVSVSGGGATLTGSPGSLVFINPNGANNTSGFTSTSDVDTLRGTALTVLDRVVFSATITGITGDLSSNGLEFGMSPNATGFRPTDNLLVGIKPTGAVILVGNSFPGTQTAAFTVNLASIYDGFGITLTANNEGWTVELTDVVLSTGTSATMSGSFTGTQFVDNFSGGHFYLAAQKDAAPDVVVNLSQASIDVSRTRVLSLVGITSN